MQQGPSIKAFLSTTAGKIVLTALATLGVFVCFAEGLGILIAIATFLFLMLAVPLYLGWRRPREIFLAGMVAILIAAPLTTFVYTQDVRSSPPALDSDSSGGGPVLTHAQVAPFSAPAGSTFSFGVTIQPQYLPADAHGPEYLVVYLSTCAGATGPTSAACGGGGYAFWQLNHTFPTAINATTSVVLTKTLNMTNLWWWLMAFVYQNGTGANNTTSHWVWVGLNDFGSGIQGPISGDFTSTYLLILPALYEAYLLYIASVFTASLVIYMFLKNREARRNPPVAGAPLPPTALGGAGGRAKGRPAIERSCPSCGAVVYPEEKACWKCGTSLPAAGSAGPLGTGPSPPAG